ncbi:MAG: type II toxin-antitoxin system CcdA family antitoxin [Candidatus Bathyarchaeia archaeon]|nr:type II toxin-antitoxin system CcdA family antitoxin [Candidatus Bathyarchaeota archaeon]
MKTKTTIQIEKELLEKAEKYGINISRTVENLLQIFIKGIEQNYTQIQGKTETLIKKEGIGNVVSDKGWWGSWDLNRRMHGDFSRKSPFFYTEILGLQFFVSFNLRNVGFMVWSFVD